MAKCKYCGQAIEWQRNPNTGAFIPLNPGTSTDHRPLCAGKAQQPAAPAISPESYLGNGMTETEKVLDALTQPEVDAKTPTTKLELLQKAMQAGIPVDGLKGLSLDELRKRLTATISDPLGDGTIVHENFWESAAFFASNPDCPQWWKGPAGSGKTTLASQLARFFGGKRDEYGVLDNFLCISINGQTEAHHLEGFRPVMHENAYNPGFLWDVLVMADKLQAENRISVVLFDEMDRGAESVLVLLNMFLENRMFRFPNGVIKTVPPNLRIIGAGNTAGRGADSTYSAAGNLDAATRDRFTVKLSHEYDHKFELAVAMKVAPGPLTEKWVRWVQLIRAAVLDLKQEGVVLSPRISFRGAKALAFGRPWDKVEKHLLWEAIPPEFIPTICAKANVTAPAWLNAA